MIGLVFAYNRAMERLLGPVRLNEMVLETYGQGLGSRFYLRLIEQARSGHFGVLKSSHPELRQAFERLARVMSHRNLSVLVYGEVGTGKRRLISEFHSLQMFLDRLDGHGKGSVTVLRADHLSEGFSQNFEKKFGAGDLVLIEKTESLSLGVQRELFDILRTGAHSYRMVFSTSVALSLRVAQGNFLRELFSIISEVSVYMPTLIDRGDDLAQLIAEYCDAMGSVKRLPSMTILNLLARLDLPKNLDDLETLIRCLLVKKQDPSTWTLEDFPPTFRLLLPQHLFSEDGGVRSLAIKKKQIAKIRRALLEYGGDQTQAAMALGLEKSQLLLKMMTLGIR